MYVSLSVSFSLFMDLHQNYLFGEISDKKKLFTVTIVFYTYKLT